MKQYLLEVKQYKLLAYLEQELLPAMEPYGHRAEVNPIDLMLGLSGCHSDFLPMFKKMAASLK